MTIFFDSTAISTQRFTRKHLFSLLSLVMVDVLLQDESGVLFSLLKELLKSVFFRASVHIFSELLFVGRSEVTQNVILICLPLKNPIFRKLAGLKCICSVLRILNYFAHKKFSLFFLQLQSSALLKCLFLGFLNIRLN